MRYITSKEIEDGVKQKLLNVLDRFIAFTGSVFYVHCFTSGKHAKNSYHYKGEAVDGHIGKWKNRKPTIDDKLYMQNRLTEIIEKKEKNALDKIVLAYLSGFNGIGIYDWGLHLDIRKKSLLWFGEQREKVEKKLVKAIEKDEGQIYFYRG